MLSFAIDAVFSDPLITEAALWRDAGRGPPRWVRVVRRAPDQGVSFGDGRFVRDSVVLEVRVSEVARPAPGDTAEIDGALFRVIGDPERDGQRLVWRCEVSEVGGAG